MRLFVLVLPLAAIAVPIHAAPEREVREIERTLRDPATVAKIGRSIEGFADALMSLKVGGLKAALEGREATPAERQLTLGDLETRRDPRAQAELREKIRSAGPAIASGMTAVADALPVMTRAMEDIGRAVDRAAANMPDPTYPKR